MDSKYLMVQISAENQEQANNILNPLLLKKLVTGGQFIKTPARFLWKEKIAEMDYCIITSYTLEKHKDEIISEVRKSTKEEVPMITFVPFEGNKELLEWIEKTLA